MSMQAGSCELTLVRLESALTLDTTPAVKEQLAPVLSCAGHVILDMRGILLDSTGLGAVLSLQRNLGLQGRKLLIVTTDPQFIGLLERTGVSGVLSLFPDAEAAVIHVHQQRKPAFAA
jgi:anti-anti-sigma factor